jgi:hypothetical protein
MITLNFDEVLERTYNAKKGVEVRYGLGQGFEYCKQFADEAQGYATNAKASEKKATDAVAGIEQTKTDAVQAVQNAQTTATTAVQQAQTAATDAVTAKQTKAVQAVGTAQTGAVKAVDDERDAALQQVADSTQAAQTAASNAAASEQAAQASKEAAATSSGAAANSATAASGSASAAATSESNAASSAQSAGADADRAEAAAALAGTRANTDKTLKTENAPADAAATGAALGKKLDLTGGTMTGPLILMDGGTAVGIQANALAHNSIPRGKNLGTSVTDEQWAEIRAGTFKDLYLGDYWPINGMDYLIGGFNYWLNTGDTACTKNHLLVVPRNNMYNGVPMNRTSTTAGGYVGSEMYKTGLTQAKQTIAAAFGSAHILNHRQCLVNAVTNGRPTGTDWYDSTVELMNENMVYGSRQFSPMLDGIINPWDEQRNHTIDKSQLPLFRLAPWLICNREIWWLRDVVSGNAFADVEPYGSANSNGTTDLLGVRPVFGLIG